MSNTLWQYLTLNVAITHISPTAELYLVGFVFIVSPERFLEFKLYRISCRKRIISVRQVVSAFNAIRIVSKRQLAIWVRFLATLSNCRMRGEKKVTPLVKHQWKAQL